MDKENFPRKIGEYIVYKKHCVYEIVDIKEEKICGTKKSYYVLKSVYDDRSAVYVPTDSEVLVSLMTSPFTYEEALAVIDESKSADVVWKEEVAERFKYFDELMQEDSLPRLISAYFLLSLQKEEALRAKKKFFAHDERTMQAALKLICEAFAFSLDIKKDAVVPFICDRLS